MLFIFLPLDLPKPSKEDNQNMIHLWNTSAKSSRHSQVKETLSQITSINIVNAPNDSLVQCGCGHIDCPMCNLMLNLKLTEPK